MPRTYKEIEYNDKSWLCTIDYTVDREGNAFSVEVIVEAQDEEGNDPDDDTMFYLYGICEKKAWEEEDNRAY